MTKFEILLDSQTEALVGGMNGWAFPSLTSKSSSMEINNLISQSNVGSAWASSASASGGGFSGWSKFMKKPESGVTVADATNIQKNFNSVNNFGFSITI